jgi:hypothetical protein
VGFLFPAFGLRLTTPSHMNDHGNPPETERSAEDGARHALTLLSSIYLEAGLPLERAIRSAIADYELFAEELLCAL